MDSYLEIRLLPDPEFVSAVLLNTLYNKLHRALVKMNTQDIGIGFPNYGQKKSDNRLIHPLGEHIRLHGTEERLEQLMNLDWLIGLYDHIRVGNIMAVPTNISKYASYRRIQVKSNVNRIRQRYMRRHDISFEEVVKLIPDDIEKTSDLPFVMLKSQSTGQTFRLFISQNELSNPMPGYFNTYGLSIGGAVPLF
jgi:CRISPR-associated endonuclease Csy4